MGDKTFRKFHSLFYSWMSILNKDKPDKLITVFFHNLIKFCCFAVKFPKAIKALKAASNGQTLLSDTFMSDSDRLLRRGLRKAAQKRPIEENDSRSTNARRTKHNCLTGPKIVDFQP